MWGRCVVGHLTVHDRIDAAARPRPRLQSEALARAVQQQYKPGVQTPENIAVGEKAVTAYQEILKTDPGNEDMRPVITPTIQI